MDDFRFSGSWWLPQRPDRKLAGELSFTSGRLQLVSYDHLRELVLGEGLNTVEGRTWTEEPVVHGIRHGDQQFVTLLGVSGSALDVPATFVTNVFEADLAYLGTVEYDSFCRVDAEFDYLHAWAHPTQRTLDDPTEPFVARIRTDVMDVVAADLEDGAELHVYSGVAGRSGTDGVDLGEYCSVSLSLPNCPWP
jgi:hypothetical protein